jgi:hypothetical protein
MAVLLLFFVDPMKTLIPATDLPPSCTLVHEAILRMRRFQLSDVGILVVTSNATRVTLLCGLLLFRYTRRLSILDDEAVEAQAHLARLCAFAGRLTFNER